jgi:hypothetical protein
MSWFEAFQWAFTFALALLGIAGGFRLIWVISHYPLVYWSLGFFLLMWVAIKFLGGPI